MGLNMVVVSEFNCSLGQMSTPLTLGIPDLKVPGSSRENSSLLDLDYMVLYSG